MTNAPDVRPFVDWGGSTWAGQVADGVAWLGNVEGCRVLEIGTRYGGMATWFALAGATVTALDIDDATFDAARARAASHGVADSVTFATYSGDPADLPHGYDIVFSKSTLVLMGSMDRLAGCLDAVLVPGGRLLTVENARGPLLSRVARAIRRRSWRPHSANYFSSATVDRIGTVFEVDHVRWTRMPPTVLIGARKRSPS